MPLITTDIDCALQDLRQAKPVAIPTETVYGLAAMIDKEEAIKTVFAMKNRPLNHPLIVHIAQDWDLTGLVDFIPDYARQWMDAFWPGPLTLVLQGGTNYPLITARQSTIAIRCPSHPLAQNLLKQLGHPLVAPSANLFGKTSPTTALHVLESFPHSDLLILDGGRCPVGIESTIVDATQADHYQILRHGLLDEQALAAVTSVDCIQKNHDLRVPGLLESHYQPNKPLYYFDCLASLHQFCKTKAGDVYLIASSPPKDVPLACFCPLGQTPEQVAFDLYYQLRQGDASAASCIAIELPPAGCAWQGVRERIMKAGLYLFTTNLDAR